MILDRTIAPLASDISFKLPQYQFLELSPAKIPVYTIQSNEDELVKVELVFEAGEKFQKKPLLAEICGKMLLEGTSKLSAKQIAESFDNEGSYIGVEVGKDFSVLTLYSLAESLEKQLYLIKHILEEATFPEKELNILLSKKKSNFLINCEKNDFEAARYFNNCIFGNQHGYGMLIKASDYDEVNRAELQQFYKEHYRWLGCHVFATSGKDQKIIKILENVFKEVEPSDLVRQEHMSETPAVVLGEKKYISKPDALQSAIRIGCMVPGRQSENFPVLSLAVTVLGGYFGSRLMANIREEKGYTYGIGASIGSIGEQGLFRISTEVGGDVTSMALEEIYKEIDKLRREDVSVKELVRVKNYLQGEMVRSFDGAFESISLLRSAITYGVSFEFYEHFVTQVQKTTPPELRTIFSTFIKEELLTEIVVGKKNQ